MFRTPLPQIWEHCTPDGQHRKRSGPGSRIRLSAKDVSFSRERLLLQSGRVFDFDAVSEDHSIVATISTSGSKTIELMKRRETPADRRTSLGYVVTLTTLAVS